MEYKEMLNLSNVAGHSKFVARNWGIANDEGKL